MNLFDVPTKKRKSGLLIPSGAEVSSANEKIAEQYEEEAIKQAVSLMGTMHAGDIASFLSTKAHSVEIIKQG